MLHLISRMVVRVVEGHTWDKGQRAVSGQPEQTVTRFVDSSNILSGAESMSSANNYYKNSISAVCVGLPMHTIVQCSQRAFWALRAALWARQGENRTSAHLLLFTIIFYGLWSSMFVHVHVCVVKADTKGRMRCVGESLPEYHKMLTKAKGILFTGRNSYSLLQATWNMLRVVCIFMYKVSHRLIMLLIMRLWSPRCKDYAITNFLVFQ